MTSKLPKSLEEMIRKNSEKWHAKWMADKMPPIHVKKIHQAGATEIASAVMEHAERLAKAANEYCLYPTVANGEDLAEALAEWNAFKGNEK